MTDHGPSGTNPSHCVSSSDPSDQPRLPGAPNSAKRARGFLRTAGQTILVAMLGALCGAACFSVYGFSGGWEVGELLYCLFSAASGAIGALALVVLLAVDAKMQSTIGRIIAKALTGSIAGAIWGATFAALDRSLGIMLPVIVGALIGVVIAFAAKVVFRVLSK